MSDLRLRELERRWQASGLSRDEAAYLAARLRHGKLTRCSVRELIKAVVYRERGETPWDSALREATSAFKRGEALLLVGDHEAQGLDTVLELTPGTQVTWLYLPELG